MVRKIFTLLFCFILVFTLLSTFILFNVRYTFLNVQFYITLLNKTSLYEKIYDAFLPFFGQIQNLAKETNIPEEEVIALTKNVIPPALLKESTEKFLQEFFAYLFGKKSSITFQIDTKPIKENLPLAAENLVKKRLADLPPCLSPQPQKEGFPTCIPQGMTKESFNQKILSGMQKGLSESLEKWPEKFPPLEFWQNAFINQVAPVRNFVRAIRLVLFISVAISILLLLLIIAVNLRHPKTIFRSLGLTFFFADFLPLIFAFGGKISSAIFSSIFVQGFNIPLPLKNEIAEIFNTISGKFLSTKMIETAIILVLAIIFFLVSFFFKKKTAPALSPPPLKPTNVQPKT